MFDKTTHSHTVTAADQELAAQYTNRPAVLPAALDTGDLVAAATSGNRITIGNGASIEVQAQEPPRSFQFGASDPAQAVVDTELDGMNRRAEFLIEQMNLMVDRETGEPRPHLIDEYNRNALILRQLQASAVFQQGYAVKAMRAKSANSAGVEQLQREAAVQDERSQNAAAREFDSIFGRTSIR